MFAALQRQLGRAFGALILYMIIFTIFHNVRTSRRIRNLLSDLPSITLDYGQSPHNQSKVALLVENRPSGLIAPLIIHFIAILPSDWKFSFMGSEESVAYVNRSAAIRRHVGEGKVDLRYLPKNMTISGQEEISRFLTNLWVYETLFQPAEWLLVYQTDSCICASHQGSVDDWLEYDWVGAPWYEGSKYGGNGGFSLRRVSSMIEVLRYQQRQNFSEPEDVWMTERLGHLPHAKTANGTESLKFSGENIWTAYPLGYHTGGSGRFLGGGIWGTPEKRQHLWNYCPEMKMTLDMDAAVFMPDVCDEMW